MTPSTPEFGTPPSKPALPPLQPPPPRVPDHTLHRIIGRGAYGEVWLGRNLMDTWRAIKVVRRTGVSDDRALQREFRGIRAFEPVSRTHPGLTDILQLGANEAEGYIYYVMELADDETTGQDINPDTYRPRSLRSDMVRRGRLPFVECLPTAVSLADALRHLHAHKLVHRDIKPSNIIFVNGIAKLADIGLVAESSEAKTYVGTDGFVPRDGAGSPGADIYALGKSLYEISTGLDRLKFPEPPPDLLKNPERDDLLELNAVILKACANSANRYACAADMHQELVLLQGGKSVRRLRAAERRWKVAKRAAMIGVPLLLLAAAGFWWQQNQAEKYKKLAVSEEAARQHAEREQHRANDLATANAELAVQERSGRERAQQEQRRAEQQTQKANQLLDRLDLDRANAFFDQDRPSEALACLARVLRRSPTNRVATVMTLNWLDYLGMPTQVSLSPRHGAHIICAAFSPDGRWVVTASGDRTARVWDAQTGQFISQFRQHEASLASAAFSPNGRWVATAAEDKTARVWEAANGKPVSPPLRHGERVNAAAFSPDGCWVVTASADCTAQVWEAASGKHRSGFLGHDGVVYSAAFSPDGRRVVTAAADNTARVWDAESGHTDCPPLRHDGVGSSSTVYSAAFSPDGRWVVTAAADNTARIWEAQNGQPVGSPLWHQAPVYSAAFSPNGRWVVTASGDKTARVWEALSGRPVSPPLRHQGWVESAAFSSDGKLVLTASRDQTARVWEAKTGQSVNLPLRNEEVVLGGLRVTLGGQHPCAAFSPDGRFVVTAASYEKSARVWRARSSQALVLALRHQGSVVDASFSPDGQSVVTAASHDNTARVWDAASGQPVSPPLRHSGRVSTAAFSPDGRWVVTASEDASAQVWDAQSGKRIGPPLRHEGEVFSATFSPDGSRVVTASEDMTAQVWDAQSGQRVSPPLRHERAVHSATFSPDGRWLVTVAPLQGACVWDAQSYKSLSPFLRCDRHSMASVVQSAAFSPDGNRLVTMAWDGTSQVWEAPGGTRVSPPFVDTGFEGVLPPSQNRPPSFSPDGSWVATPSAGQNARVWNAKTGDPVSPPLQHDRPVYSATFSPDGCWVVTASWDGTARVWEAQSGQPVSPPLRHDERRDRTQRGVDEWGVSVFSAVFSPDGRRVVTASSDGTARLWDTHTGHNPEVNWLADLAEAVGGLTASDAGEFVPVASPPEDWRSTRAEINNTLTGQEASDAGEFVPRALKLDGLRSKVLATTNTDDLSVWGRWFVSDPRKRTINVFSKTTVAEYMNSLGIAYYRAKDYTNAISTLLEASSINTPASNRYAADSDFYFLAMAHHQLGNPAKAREFYDKAVAEWDKRMAQPGAQQDAELKSFRAEAEKLLGIPRRE